MSQATALPRKLKNS